ncbi:MAG: ATP-binding cassette domain-containing protein [Salinirussus sp.]
MIEIENVAISYDTTPVLADIDMSVQQGEFLGLVGPNGAGKTTLLNAVNGLVEPDTGSVRVNGDQVASLGARELGRRVATVPQDTHLEFGFSVEAIVEMGRTPHRGRLDWSAAEAAVDAALDRTDTDHLRNRSVDAISGGERQRVLLARALAQEAPVLVLDEPTGSLDVNHQLRVLDLVRGLVDEGRTAIAAIHDLDLAARYCDRLALLHDGSLERVGRPETVLGSATIEATFDTAAAVTDDAVTATPRVTAVGTRPERDTHVHVVGHGRQAARALGDCWSAGFDVSAGIVPDGDAVAGLAGDLEIPVVTAPAFEPVTPEVTEALESLLDEADVVVRAIESPNTPTMAALDSIETIVNWEGSDVLLDDDEGVGGPDSPPLHGGRDEQPPVVRAVLAATPQEN